MVAFCYCTRTYVHERPEDGGLIVLMVVFGGGFDGGLVGLMVAVIGGGPRVGLVVVVMGLGGGF